MTAPRALAIGAALALSCAPSHAAERAQLCPSAREAMAKAPDLAAAMAAAYGRLPVRRRGDDDADCIYPVDTLHFADAYVLLTIAQDPDTACHGCSATLTASVLRREGAGLKLVNRAPNVVEIGSNGVPGTITPIAFGGDDGFVVEGGGTFQGHTSTAAAVVVFRGGRAINPVSYTHLTLPTIYSV